MAAAERPRAGSDWHAELVAVEREITALASQRQSCWRRWAHTPPADLEEAWQRRQQLRALERRLANAWARKRALLAQVGSLLPEDHLAPAVFTLGRCSRG